jgi:hypothetical protein
MPNIRNLNTQKDLDAMMLQSSNCVTRWGTIGQRCVSKGLSGFAMVLSTSVALAFGQVAAAQEPVQLAPAQPAPLSYTLTAYVWGAGINGEQTLLGLPTVDLDLSFGDILDNLDFALAGMLEVRGGGRAGFLGELNYVALSAAATGPGGLVTGTLDSKAFFALAAGTYEIAKENTYAVQAIGGLKYFRFENDLALSPGSVAGSVTESWVDATIGLKARFELAPDWSLTTWAMVGAGGSDLSWDALAAVNYEFNPAWSVSLGYRAIGIDYTSPEFSYDIVQSGPILGINARF